MSRCETCPPGCLWCSDEACLTKMAAEAEVKGRNARLERAAATVEELGAPHIADQIRSMKTETHKQDCD